MKSVHEKHESLRATSRNDSSLKISYVYFFQIRPFSDPEKMIQAWPRSARIESTSGFFKNSYWFTLTLIGISDRFAVGLLRTDPQRDLPFPCVTNHEHLFDVVSEDLQRQLPFLHPPLPALQEATPASLHRTEHALHDGPQMIHGQPSIRVTFPGLEGDDICEAAAWSTSRIYTETEVWCSVFIGY